MRALGALADERARPVLRALAKQADEEKRKQAEDAIEFLDLSIKVKKQRARYDLTLPEPE